MAGRAMLIDEPMNGVMKAVMEAMIRVALFEAVSVMAFNSVL
jgi:hypothetical protein